ncbi:MAG: M20/M25/M40 family metallo-hydrolase [Gemmatimonadaceae bacterium]
MLSDASFQALWNNQSLISGRERLAALDDDILASQITISEIPAPTGEESRRAEWISRRFRSAGLADVRVDRTGNVIGRRRGATEAPPVLICAHLDTVFPRGTGVSVRRTGSRLTGPGIGDNGRGLAVMLALAEVIDGVRLRTDLPIDFVATTGEEGAGDLRGAKNVFADYSRMCGISAAIALDGAGDERIVCRALGSRRYRISYHGAGGHSWTAYGAPNAVHAVAVAAAKLARLPLPSTPRTSLSVGRIGGGISINAIPDESWLEVDLRSTSARTIHEIDSQVRSVARAAEAEENGRRAHGTPPLTSNFAVIGDRPNGETPADHPLVIAAIQATRMIGREPDLATASTDANVPISRGIPAIAIGAGGHGGDAHTVSEWFDNSDGRRGIERALGIVIAAAGGARD